jgi:D-glycerate 3-kinase
MTESTARRIATLAEAIDKRYAARIDRSDRPFLLGISGLQGSGKSTDARALARHATDRGCPSITLSLDDVYLTRTERLRLAHDVHPLLATRGVPGTHDIGLLEETLDRLGRATPAQPAAIPRFDKGKDDREPLSAWPTVDTPPRLIVLEGWCLGVPAEDSAALAQPVNALERDEDPDGRWRRWVNERLAGYASLWRRIDALVVLQAPDWSVVRAWRDQAEQPLRERHEAHAMDKDALDRFLQYYERISRHALATLPAIADCCIRLDEDRTPHFPP